MKNQEEAERRLENEQSILIGGKKVKETESDDDLARIQKIKKNLNERFFNSHFQLFTKNLPFSGHNVQYSLY